MQGIFFRPWGLLPWVLGKLPKTKWSMLACLSCSERCLASFEYLSYKRFVGKLLFWVINDPQSNFSRISATKIAARRRDFLRLGGLNKYIQDHDLFERTEYLVEGAQDFIKSSGPNVVLDVTSFPKRFFLPILRLLLEAKTIENLLVTYTIPQKYSRDALAENPEPWRHIPLFAPRFPEEKVKVLIVGLGFETLGLPDLLEHDYHDVNVRLFFPFPPGPPNFQRTWEFVRRLEIGLASKSLEPIRVPALDISDAFDHILSVTDAGKMYSCLAPYGPKPLSVAMCLYAAQSDNPIYYTQPRIYNPDYCSGIKQIHGHHATYGYCIRLQGKSLYQLPA
jgi:hypothetical protein